MSELVRAEPGTLCHDGQEELLLAIEKDTFQVCRDLLDNIREFLAAQKGLLEGFYVAAGARIIVPFMFGLEKFAFDTQNFFGQAFRSGTRVVPSPSVSVVSLEDSLDAGFSIDRHEELRRKLIRAGKQRANPNDDPLADLNVITRIISLSSSENDTSLPAGYDRAAARGEKRPEPWPKVDNGEGRSGAWRNSTTGSHGIVASELCSSFYNSDGGWSESDSESLSWSEGGQDSSDDDYEKKAANGAAYINSEDDEDLIERL